MRIILALILASCAASLAAAAENKEPSAPPDPYAWSVHVYRFPAEELRGGFVSPERGQLHAPPVPPANANTDDIRKFLKSSNDVVTQYLQVHGVPLLKGSLVAVDAEHDMLIARVVNSTHDLIASLAQGFIEHLPSYVSFNANLVEADAGTVRQMVKDASATADHKALWDRVQALADQGQARHIGTLAIDTRSGQRATVERGMQRLSAEGFAMNEQGWFGVPASGRHVGTGLEIDSVIGPDGLTLDLNYGLEHHFAPPSDRWEPAAQNGTKRIETRVTDFHLAKLTTATTMLSGMTKLLSVWAPETSTSPDRGKVLQAAFLKGTIVPLLPLEDHRVEEMFAKHGEAVVPTLPPVKALPNEGLPPGMILRRFRVPPDFLSLGGSGAAPAAPADPFASAAPPANEPRGMRSVTAMDILKMQGIPFPEGSSANFSRISSELIIRNFPKNVEQVAAFLDELIKKSPLVIGVTVHVVQADGPLMRRLATQSGVVADHSAVWQSIEDAAAQGKVSILRTLWLETRSGQRATATSGTEYMLAGSPSIENAAVSAQSKPDDKNAGTANSQHGAGGNSTPVLSVSHETRQVGLEFEIDPVIGPDGSTVDVNASVKYNTAPPTQRFDPGGGADPVVRVDSPGTDFHSAEATTAITMTKGTTRLLGIWKPEGRPEFDNADVLQAAFIRVDLIQTTPDDSAKAPK